jgi:hypothetical protein
MRSKFFLIMVTIALLWGGGQGTLTLLTNLSPKRYSVDTYIQKRPPEKWLQLADGELNMLEVSYMSILGVGPLTEIYIPLRPVGYKDGDRDQILVATKDPELLDLAWELRDAKSSEEIARVILQSGKSLSIHRDVKGLIREGIDLKDSDVRKLRKVNPNLADDFIILAEGARPEPTAILLLVAGLFLGAYLLKKLFRAKTSVADGEPPPLPPRGIGPPPLPR